MIICEQQQQPQRLTLTPKLQNKKKNNCIGSIKSNRITTDRERERDQEASQQDC